MSDALLQLLFYSIYNFIRHRNRRIIVIKAVAVTAEQLNDSCSICLEKYEINEKVVNLKCKHLFHKTCFQQWVAKSVYCPLCRQMCDQ